MSNKTPSNLTAGTALDGTEVFHGVQGGNSRKFTGAQIATLAADGRDLSADGAKLDAIEAGADVTDAINVAAAGAIIKTAGDVSLDNAAIVEETTYAGLTPDANTIYFVIPDA